MAEIMNPTYATLETAIVILFLVACFHAWRRGSLLEITSAALYGLLLEEGDILIFQTYNYSPEFILRIDRVPVAIALAWAIIIYTCMHLSDAYGLPGMIAPFADALWAIMLDLAFDAVAIRLGFWTWVIPLDKGFFGVPAGNFYAWLFVAFSFSVFTRLMRSWTRKNPSRSSWQLGIPFVAYGSLLFSMAPFFVLRNAFFPEQGGGLPIFWTVLCVFILLVVQHMVRNGTAGAAAFDWLTVALRSSFHMYFLVGILTSGMFASVPALLGLSIGMICVEAMLALLMWKAPKPLENVANR